MARRVAVLGGGPGGYEAALVAAQLGAQVTLVERDGPGGSAVLTDCVPSKALVATAQVLTRARESDVLGLRLAPVIEAVTGSAADAPVGAGAADARPVADGAVDAAAVNARIRALAAAQSADVAASLRAAGVRTVSGTGRLLGPAGGRSGWRVGWTADAADHAGADRAAEDGSPGETTADVVLVATGAGPRQLPDAPCDGERILSWTQLYDLGELPEHLVVVGSGVTGAEFAGAYRALGSRVTLVSSRDRVLPGEDADAAAVLEAVFARRGMTVLSRSRAATVVRSADGVVVRLTDGREVTGSHCLVAVGSVPNTAGTGADAAGVELTSSGHVVVDRVSRTTAPGVYAAGDCTGVLPLASVAAMQGRIAMAHALGDTVAPLDLGLVSATVFTDPEIATVGRPPDDSVRVETLPLHGNARAKMQGFTDGFVKLFARPATGIVTGGVLVAPGASELAHPLSLALAGRLTVDEVARAFTVYPSLSGSLAEAARRLHRTAAD